MKTLPGQRPLSRRPSSFLWLPVLLTLLGLYSGGVEIVSAQSPAPETGAAPSVAVIESAKYVARLQGDDLTSGTFEFDVQRTGTMAATLDWSTARITLGQVRWNNGPVVAGVSGDQRLLAVIDRPKGRMVGNWSLHGEMYGETAVFDAAFPPALNSRLDLEVPQKLQLSSSQGLVRESGSTESGMRKWTVELGRASSVILKISPRERTVSQPRYEIETLMIARRDGIVLQADLNVDGTFGNSSHLPLEVPPAVDVQSVSIGGVSLPVQRSKDNPEQVLVQLEGISLEPRFTLRLRGFEGVTWGDPHQLPRIRLIPAVVTRRALSIRVEPPLQMRRVEPLGMIQTALSIDEALGEIWKFEAREPGGQVSVDINFPETELSSQIDCLLGLTPSEGWAAALVGLQLENGARLETTLQLPAGWDLVTVTGGDYESRIASWTLQGQELHVSFQNALTPTSPRQLRLYMRCPPLTDSSAVPLLLPLVKDSSEASLLCQCFLPTNRNLELGDGETCRLSDQIPLDRRFLSIKEVNERIQDFKNRPLLTVQTLSPQPARQLDVQILTTHGRGGASTTLPSLAETEPVRNPLNAPNPPPTLWLRTTAGPATNPARVHHAAIRFPSPIATSLLQLELSDRCRVSNMLVNGEPVNFSREGVRIRLPGDVTQISNLHLTYITQGEQSLLSSKNRIPLPQIGLPYELIDWELELPEENHLVSFGMPGALMGAPPPTNWTRRFFGPLGRGATEGFFNPLSASDWHVLLDGQQTAAAASQPLQRIYHLQVPGNAQTAEFVAWNEPRNRGYAWGALLGCLLLGSAARMFNLNHVRRLTPVWLALLALAAVILPSVWSAILGGMFVGSLISILLPRRFIQRTDFLARTRIPAPARQVIAGLLIGGLATLARADAPEPISQAAAGLPASPAAPTSLIRAARYELRRRFPVASVHATLEVLVKGGTPEVLVRLPARDITLPPGAQCLVDGAPTEMLPLSTGDAFVVRIETPLSLQDGADWESHQIEFDFNVRSLPPERDEQLSPLAGQVPGALDTTLLIPNAVTSEDFERWGQSRREPTGARLLQLGSSGRLVSRTPDTVRSLPNGLQAVTLLDVSPLRLKGQTRISAPGEPLPRRLDVYLPAGCLLGNVTGSAVEDWVESRLPNGETQLSIRSFPDHAGGTATFTFDLPEIARPGAEMVTIPAFRLWNAPHMPHSIGITVPPASSVSLLNGPGPVPLTTEEWLARVEAGRTRPAVAFQLTEPQPVSIQWNRLQPDRTAVINETVTIRKETLGWTANVRTTISRVPTFRHQFRLPADVILNSLTCTDRGQEGPIRFTRQGDLLTIFVAGGQLGERNYQFHGYKPLRLESWQSIPVLEIQNTAGVETQLALVDETFWNVEMETASGAATQVSPTDGAETRESAGSRQLAVFPGTHSLRPVRIRLIPPPEVFRADSVVRLTANDKGSCDLQQQVRLSAVSDIPLRRARFLIPNGLKLTGVRPPELKPTLTSSPLGDLVTIRLPERLLTGATVTFQCRLSNTLQEALLHPAEQGETAKLQIPLVQVLSAQHGSQTILLEQRSPWTLPPESSLPVETPGWMSSEWRTELQSQLLSESRQAQNRLDLILKSSTAGQRRMRIPLEETFLWPLEDGTVRGLSRVWVAAEDGTGLSLQIPEGLRITRVENPGRQAIPHFQSENQLEITLPPGAHNSPILLDWQWDTRANPELSLLEYDGILPDVRLAGAARSPSQMVELKAGATLSPLEVWLQRWEGLLNLLTLPTGKGERHHALHEIIGCQQEVDRLLTRHRDSIPPALREKAEELATRSRQKAGELLAAGQDPAWHNSNQQDFFNEQLVQSTRGGLLVDWSSPSQQNWGAQVKPLPQFPSLWGLAVGLMLVIGTGWLALRHGGAYTQFRDRLSGHPSVSLLILGIAWWLFLSPGILGLAVIVIALMLPVLSRGGRKRRGVHSSSASGTSVS
ncbi:hypothetical protein [Planctomicrobium sp. SH664]|uniref:hypothetical protein n=1 Tax=Planctomicrobium sp. SH664 TaxID=3448125 RepID=UPI003F5C5509